MRPRSKTAENARPVRPWPEQLHRFNEAAVEDRGKPRLVLAFGPAARRFNEAAVEDRGKPSRPARCESRSTSFNEAAVEDRGNAC